MRQSLKHGQRKNLTRFYDGDVRQNREPKREARI